MGWREYIQSLGRKKSEDDPLCDDGPKLARVLTVFDLTGLGVGSTLGLGVYVLAGSVAREQAGPAVVISFLIAAVASAFAGLCYAEFAARVPKAGSAYVYSYVTVGELIAFVIGWNLVLEYVIGTASVARGLGGYIDALANNTMRTSLTEAMPINVNFLSPYPDFLSFALVLVLTVLLALGVKESTILNNIFTVVNVIVILIVVISGSLKATTDNWTIPKENLTHISHGGEGGFAPFGIAGIMAGAAKCFYGFVGFDCIATTGEEAKNPKRDIPLSIIISLIVIFVSYFSVSTILTMMWPYYDQNVDAPFPYVFEQIGYNEIKWIVTIGAIFALCTSMLGAMFPLPRVLYAMAKDGVIFRKLSTINSRTHTPILATSVAGLLSGIMALMFDLQQLIDMMSIGTLLAYTIVALCVLLLRFEDPETDLVKNVPITASKGPTDGLYHLFRRVFNLNMIKVPNDDSAALCKWAVIIFTLVQVFFCGLIDYILPRALEGFSIELVFFILVMVLVLLPLLVLARQPHTTLSLTFKVPFVPLVPALSVIMNTYLMFQLDVHTWIRFAVWLVVGLATYFWYGHSNSSESAIYKDSVISKNVKQEVKL